MNPTSRSSLVLGFTRSLLSYAGSLTLSLSLPLCASLLRETAGLTLGFGFDF